jgi:hypothetical protein
MQRPIPRQSTPIHIQVAVISALGKNRLLIQKSTRKASHTHGAMNKTITTEVPKPAATTRKAADGESPFFIILRSSHGDDTDTGTAFAPD